MSAEPLTRSQVFLQLRKELYGESAHSNTTIFIILGASVSTMSEQMMSSLMLMREILFSIHHHCQAHVFTLLAVNRVGQEGLKWQGPNIGHEAFQEDNSLVILTSENKSTLTEMCCIYVFFC